MDQKQSDKTKRKKKKKKRGIGKTLLISFLVIILIVIGAGTGVMVGVIKSTPAIDVDILNNLKQTSTVYDKDETLMETVSGEVSRTIVPLNDIPKNLQHAFVAIEDERFYTHGGIDVKRIFGAIFHNLKTMSKSQGASTLTQQLIKNYALTPEKKYTRKLQEMYLSLQLEKKLSKEQILEAYLNTIYLGGRNTCGVKDAALLYFGDTEFKDLSLAQCALIAGITQNPSKYYPYSERNKNDPKAYIDRQHTVLAKMLENGYITQDQYEKAKAEKLTFVNKKPVYSGKYQWYVDPALDTVTKDLAAKEGISEKDAKSRISNGGYKIYLSIDTKLQEAAQKVIDNQKNYSGLYVSPKYRNYSPNEKGEKKIQPQAAAAIFDYNTGEMRAIIGGRGDHEIGSQNRALEPRQPGSTIKPLSVYAPALDKREVSSSTPIKTTPLTASETEKGWSPNNASSNLPDIVTVREGLIRSINTVAARIGKMIGKDTSMDYLQNKFHLSTLVKDDNNLAPLTLGGLTKGALATEMAAAYGVFGNKGMYANPIMYTKVVDRNGNIVLENKSVKSRSISANATYNTLDMLEGVVSKNKSPLFGSMPVAGKTGTTNESKTVWFTGLTPYYSGAVWVGHDKPSIPVDGLNNTYPARIWSQIMEEAHKNLPVKDFDVPASFKSESVEICPVSGKRYTDDCKAAGISPITERFPSGSVPSEICDVHTGAKTNEHLTTPTEETPQTTTPTTPQPNGDGNGGTTKPDGNKPGDTHTKPGNDTNTPSDGNTKPGDNGNTKPENNQGPDNGGGNTTQSPPTALRNILNTLFGVILWK